MIVKLVAKFAPWLSPIPTAYFVSRSSMAHLATPLEIAIIIGVVLELLGVATVHTALNLYRWNIKPACNKEKGAWEKAPLNLAIAACGVYFGAVLLLSVFLETFPSLAAWAAAVFPFVSLTGMATLAIIYQHEERVAKYIRKERKPSSTEKQVEEKGKLDTFVEKNVSSRRVSTRLSREVLLRDGWHCYYCGVDMSDWNSGKIQIDHFYPRKNGGTNTPFNLVVSCYKCNASKGAHIPSENEISEFRIHLVKTASLSTKEKVWLLDNLGLVSKQSDIATALEITPSYVSSSLKKKPDELPNKLGELGQEILSVGEWLDEVSSDTNGSEPSVLGPEDQGPATVAEEAG